MAEEQGKKEESTEKVVALQTMYIKDISFEAPNSPDVFLETDISPETKIISPHGIQKLTTNMLASDIATIGPKDFAFMPTTGMGHGLGGSVIIDPQESFSSSKGDYSWGGMASTYFWIDRVSSCQSQ